MSNDKVVELRDEVVRKRKSYKEKILMYMNQIEDHKLKILQETEIIPPKLEHNISVPEVKIDKEILEKYNKPCEISLEQVQEVQSKVKELQLLEKQLKEVKENNINKLLMNC